MTESSHGSEVSIEKKLEKLQERNDYSWDEFDVVVVPHEQLDEFVEYMDDEELESITIYTEDEYTSGRNEFNLIAMLEDDYGIATQVSCYLNSRDIGLDLRFDEKYLQVIN